MTSMRNDEMGDALEELADYLEIKGENPFKVRAYRNASRIVREHRVELADEVAAGRDLTEIHGIGKELAVKITAMVETGHFALLERTKAEFPSGVPLLLKLPGLGPKRVRMLLDEAQITSLDDLIAAAGAQRLRTLPGFGPKLEASLLDAATKRLDTAARHLRAKVEPVVAALCADLARLPGVRRCEPAGSFRRGRDTIGDIDLLVVADDGAAVMEAFTTRPGIERVLARGETKGSLLLRGNLQVDLRLVPAESFGAALHYFTGSKEHNIATRRRAQQRDLKQNEYGVFRGEEAVAGATEEDVYAALDLPWIPPELREDRGEIEAAEQGALPELVGVEDLCGDVHNHTDWSDGQETLAGMAAAAAKRGWEYLAITDHSKRLTVANGLDERRLREQLEAIDALNATHPGVAVLKGSEVDILENGDLDLPDSVLRELDVVVIAVHSKFNLDRDAQTERILRALDHPYVSLLAHPTGRLLLEREPYALDMERVLDAVAARGCFIELNAHPLRLDLHDGHVCMARERGILVAISNDAHGLPDFDHHRHGVLQARRGWLEKKDVLNALPLAALRKKLRGTFR